jgi:hypothetical protein
MYMNIYKKLKWLLFGMAATGSTVATAQSSTADNGYRGTSATDSTFEFSEFLYIGPNAVWEINGVHVIYSTNIWIAPTAQITGNGKLIIADPSTNPMRTVAAQPTVIDGNNSNFINLNIEHHNPANIVLADITDPGYGTTNPSGALSAALKVGKNFAFGVDNGDVMLNGNDFIFESDATISGYGPNRMVVTGNSIEGHMVKQNNAATTFTFPIGIAQGDYTPATITGANTYNVSVIDYSFSTPTITVPAEGMDRTWHIFGGTASSVTLQHNAATNGADYVDDQAFITRYQGSGNWSTGTPEQTAAGIHTNSAAIGADIPATATDGAFLSKSSDPESPLPIMLHAFDAQKESNTAALLTWTTNLEINNSGFSIERSLDSKEWSSIGFVTSLAANGNSHSAINYKFTDKQVANGKNYYRLKIVSLNGETEYSEVRMLQFDNNRNVRVYPNPTKDFAIVDGLEKGDAVYIYDATGRLLSQTKADLAQITLPLQGFATGSYYITILHSDGARATHKIVKQ